MRHDQSLCPHERVTGVFIFGDSQSESRHLLTAIAAIRRARAGEGGPGQNRGPGTGPRRGVAEFFPKGTTPSNGCRGENRSGGSPGVFCRVCPIPSARQFDDDSGGSQTKFPKW